MMPAIKRNSSEQTSAENESERGDEQYDNADDYFDDDADPVGGFRFRLFGFMLHKRSPVV